MAGYAGQFHALSLSRLVLWERRKGKTNEVKPTDAFLVVGFLCFEQSYMLLLLLEYARVMADDREAMSYRP